MTDAASTSTSESPAKLASAIEPAGDAGAERDRELEQVPAVAEVGESFRPLLE